MYILIGISILNGLNRQKYIMYMKRINYTVFYYLNDKTIHNNKVVTTIRLIILNALTDSNVILTLNLN